MNGRWFTAYLFLTTVVSGALVMIIEVLGSRVIGPFFGVSLFVWTSLIAVTLIALAAGYAFGGWLADRFSSPDVLYGLLCAAGLFTLPIPWMRAAVLEAVLPLGLRGGALTAALVLFAPALFLLGCVTPYVARLAVREMRHLGRTIGVFYAGSTAGSIAGTVLAGFFLIPALGVSRVFLVIGACLIALGAGYFFLFRRSWLPSVLLLMPFIAVPPPPQLHGRMPDGTAVAVVHQRESPYGAIKVIDYRLGARHTRELLIDGLVQGGMDMGSGESIYEYSYLLQWLPYALNPGGKRCLVIGLGAGLVPRWYRARGVETEVVDIDPAIVAVARDFFGVSDEVNVRIADARAFLLDGDSRYDFLVLDVFNGDTTPGHLLSLEALRLARSRLSEGGVMAINLMGSLEKNSFMTASIIRTLEAVFAHVRVYPAFVRRETEQAGNFVIIAHDGAARAPDGDILARATLSPWVEAVVRPALRTPVSLPADAPFMLLTDDHNPIDARDLWLKERVRREILDSTPPALLHGSAPGRIQA